MDTPTYLRRHQAADYLQANYGFGTTETLAKLACVGGGPRYRKLGRFPVYTPEDLQAWAESRLSSPVASTAEFAEQRRQG
ncbi:helix-turn-helix transcriptional regulator [Sphingobium fuliginis]|uniref:DNA-binding protein n=1 Tax=Sphingobium fuliginis (strain ATCC 27551) TaxID=336203 RepID=A0A292ZEF3_SPHSA|nr:hypothetical protein [Sphingobium fuliginis]GAY21195.1 hypothetical protein SFOMI_1730 [Sphingobium fuliginis]